MWRDPLLHFAVLGAAIFGVYAMTHTRPVIEAPSVEAAQDEVLFREALARGLERDDDRVRQRLIVRMERSLVDPIEPPSDEQLVDFYATHRAMFPRFSRSAVFEAWVVAQGQAQLHDRVAGLMRKYNVTVR